VEKERCLEQPEECCKELKEEDFDVNLMNVFSEDEDWIEEEDNDQEIEVFKQQYDEESDRCEEENPVEEVCHHLDFNWAEPGKESQPSV
jgi:hypothetical protein